MLPLAFDLLPPAHKEHCIRWSLVLFHLVVMEVDCAHDPWHSKLDIFSVSGDLSLGETILVLVVCINNNPGRDNLVLDAECRGMIYKGV